MVVPCFVGGVARAGILAGGSGLFPPAEEEKVYRKGVNLRKTRVLGHYTRTQCRMGCKMQALL